MAGKIPNIGEFVRGSGKLLAVETILPIPPEPHKEYIFEEITARIELRLGHEVVKVLESLNDFYGLETSIKSAIEEAKEYADNRNLSNNSELAVIVIKQISQYRATLSNDENYYASKYASFKSLGSTNLPQPIETIVWSSKTNTIEQPLVEHENKGGVR